MVWKYVIIILITIKLFDRRIYLDNPIHQRSKERGDRENWHPPKTHEGCVKTWNQTKWQISSTRTIYWWCFLEANKKLRYLRHKDEINFLQHQQNSHNNTAPPTSALGTLENYDKDLYPMVHALFGIFCTICVTNNSDLNGLLLRSASENMTWDNYAPNKINRLGATTYSIIIMISKWTLTKLSKNMIFKSIICGTILKPILYHTKKQPTPRSAISFIP